MKIFFTKNLFYPNNTRTQTILKTSSSRFFFRVKFLKDLTLISSPISTNSCFCSRSPIFMICLDENFLFLFLFFIFIFYFYFLFFIFYFLFFIFYFLFSLFIFYFLFLFLFLFFVFLFVFVDFHV
jgi:hypothetical protein